jgi:hypothetical protein
MRSASRPGTARQPDMALLRPTARRQCTRARHSHRRKRRLVHLACTPSGTGPVARRESSDRARKAALPASCRSRRRSPPRLRLCCSVRSPGRMHPRT